MLFKSSSILIALLFVTLAGTAQEDKKEMGSFSERLEYGGNVSLQISNGFTFIGASPFIGYKLTPRLSSGVGFSGFYYSRNFGGLRIRNGFYGPNLYSRLVIAEETSIADQLFITSEFHAINNETYTYDPLAETLTSGRSWIPIWFVGAGGYVNIGGRMRAGLTVMWDIIDDRDQFGERNSPWPNPFISGGIIIQ